MRGAMEDGGAVAATVAEMEGYLNAEQVARKVLAFVAGAPGTIQKNLYAKVGEEKGAVSATCYMLALVGLLRREKHGNSYALYVA
jgi:hypothetical protein